MKILIIGPAWVGDMVMAQGLFKTLKLEHPDCIIDVLAPNWTIDLLNRMPEINNSISLPFKHGEFNLLSRFKLGRSLKNKNYNWSIILPNSWKSALIPFFARIPKRTGWLGELRFGLLNNIYFNPKQHKLMITRFITLCGNNSEKLPPKLISKNNAIKNSISLCPGAEFGSSKRWPEKYYAQIANYFIDKNIDVWLMGSNKDKLVTDQINLLTQNKCINYSGKTSLGEAIDLLSQTRLVITNDSGLMHIAAALDKPLIALYGSTSPDFTPPLSDKSKILSTELECRPCFQRECPLKHHNCMNNLYPNKIIEAIESCEY